MSARVRVATDHEGGLVAIKAARTLEERLALRYEAGLLRRCGHPGVVALVGPADLDGPLDEYELAVRYVGDPIDRWRGDLRQTAGLVAAIAATLGDLHDMSVVHGRLDGSHVLVGADGRPRLCGFAPPGDRTAADDVLRLGHLATDLAERMVPVEQRWPLWRRGDVADRRAFIDVLRRATTDDPERRPSARAFATALLGAVPGAELPTGSADATTPLPHPAPATAADPGPATRAPGPDAAPPQPSLWDHNDPPSPTDPTGALPHDPSGPGDPAWSAAPPTPPEPQYASDDPDEGLSPNPVDHPGRRWTATAPQQPGPEPSDDLATEPVDRPGRHWTAALPQQPGPEPSDDLATEPFDRPGRGWTAAGPQQPGDESGEGLTPEPGDRPGGGWSEAGPQRPRDESGEGLAAGPGDRPGRGWTAAGPLAGFESGANDVLVPPVVEPSRWWPVGPEIPDDRPVPAPSRLVRPEDRRAVARPADDRQPPRPGTRCVDPVFGDQSSTELGEVFVDRPWPTGRSGDHGDDRAPRPPSPSRRRRPRRSKPARSKPAAPVAAGLAAVVAGTVIYYTGWMAPPGGPEPSASAECETPPPTAPVVADVDGDGCTEEVRITDGIVQVDGQTWAVGGADDSVAVADWNCDGRATPAVYQPATGHVFVFPRWADDQGPLEVAATGSVPGGAAIVADAGDPCPSLAIEMPDGEHRPVEVAG